MPMAHLEIAGRFPLLKGRHENRSISTLAPRIWERMLALEKLGGFPLASGLLQRVKGLTDLIRCNTKSERWPQPRDAGKDWQQESWDISPTGKKHPLPSGGPGNGGFQESWKKWKRRAPHTDAAFHRQKALVLTL